MGICHEFGPSIQDGCRAPMVATRPDACTCPSCGVVCHGRFPGCATVWARGPQAVHWRAGEDAQVATPAAVVPAPAVRLEDVAADMQRLVDEVAGLKHELERMAARLDAEVVPPAGPPWQGRTA